MSAILAHLAYWDGVAITRWRDLIDQRRPPVHIPDSVNDEMLPSWRSVSGPDAVRQVVDAAEAVDWVIATAPPPLVEEMRRVGGERTVDRSLHRTEHSDEIESALRPRG